MGDSEEKAIVMVSLRLTKEESNVFDLVRAKRGDPDKSEYLRALIMLDATNANIPEAKFMDVPGWLRKAYEIAIVIGKPPVLRSQNNPSNPSKGSSEQDTIDQMSSEPRTRKKTDTAD
jgi:hypothetical protein